VTGASGFLGRAIVQQLVARAARVRVFVRRDDAALAQLGVELALGDVRDPAAVRTACQGISTVFHVWARGT
jgi:uncharacterized protein YbjT (DUF2867 family)